MKLYTLEMQGIGPFAHTESIDFRLFDDAGIFLIHGKTGSGKSSILDALVFALYGDVAGEGDRRKDRLRSHYLSSKEKSLVTLVFGSGEGVYRVVRETNRVRESSGSIAYGRTSLEEVRPEADGSFTHLRAIASAKKETETEIIRLVGLTREQFTQTVLLPQGRFARFLSAKSDARREILQSIFGTQRFSAYEAALLEQAKEHTARFSQEEVGVRTAYHSACTAFAAVAHSLPAVKENTPAETPQAAAQGLEPTDADLPEDDLPGNDLPGAVVVPDMEAPREAFDDLLAELRAQSSALDEATAAAEEDQHKVNAELNAAKEALANAQQHRALVTTREELAEQAQKFHSLKDRLAQAQRVAPLAHPLREAGEKWEALVEAHHSTCSHVLATTQRLVEDRPRDIGTAHSALKDANVSLHQEQVRLAPLVAAEKEHQRDCTLLEKRRATYQECHTAYEAEKEEAEGLPDAIAQADATYRQAELSAQRVETLSSQVKDLETRLDAARDAKNEQTVLDRAEKALTKALGEATEAHAHAQALRERWLADAAASLASELVDGQACAVCGSVTHPNPAHPHEDDAEPVTREAVEDAQESSTMADTRVEQTRTLHSDSQIRLRELTALAQGSIKEIESSLTDKRRELQTSSAEQSRLPAYRAALEALQQRSTELQQRLLTQAQDLAEERTAISAETARLKEQASQITEAAGDYPSVAQRAAAISSLLREVDQTLAQIEDLREHATRWRSAQEGLERAMALIGADSLLEDAVHTASADLNAPQSDEASSPLSATHAALAALEWEAQPWERLEAHLPTGDFVAEVLPLLLASESARVVQRAHAALMSPDFMDAAARSLAEYEHKVADTDAQLALERYSALTGDEEATVTRLTQESADASQRHIAAAQKAATLANALGQLSTHIDAFLSRREALHQAQQAFIPLQRLAKLASASADVNPSRIDLRTWVLITLFKDVLAAANHHLHKISHGRYELIHALGSKGNTKHGLELSIVDHDVDVTRDASTLSGGESFYCSLALALGLAEIVTGENGGIELRTIFIDEGFGSLDSETLDNVMRIFHDLHNEGRLIGVISHVAEMLTHIPEKIRVDKTAAGSRLRIEA